MNRYQVLGRSDKGNTIIEIDDTRAVAGQYGSSATEAAQATFQSTTAIVVRCRGGHGPLIEFVTPSAEFTCNGCTGSLQRDLPQGTPMWGCRACDYDLCERCHCAATMRDGRLSARQRREAAPAVLFDTPFVSDVAFDDSDGEGDDDTYEDESWSEDSEEDEFSLENVNITCGCCCGTLELQSPVECDCGGRHDQLCDQCPTPFQNDEYSFVCKSKTCECYIESAEDRGYTVCIDCAVDEHHDNRNDEKEERAQDRLAARKDREKQTRAAAIAAALKVALASRGQAKADGGEGKADGEPYSASFAANWTRVEGVSQYEEADEDSIVCSRYYYRHNTNGEVFSEKILVNLAAAPNGQANADGGDAAEGTAKSEKKTEEKEKTFCQQCPLGHSMEMVSAASELAKYSSGNKRNGHIRCEDCRGSLSAMGNVYRCPDGCVAGEEEVRAHWADDVNLFQSISSNPAYANKSHEELRWEDISGQAANGGAVAATGDFGAGAAMGGFGAAKTSTALISKSWIRCQMCADYIEKQSKAEKPNAQEIGKGGGKATSASALSSLVRLSSMGGNGGNDHGSESKGESTAVSDGKGDEGGVGGVGDTRSNVAGIVSLFSIQACDQSLRLAAVSPTTTAGYRAYRYDGDDSVLVEEFAEIMATEADAARFFLEASSWNVEDAVDSYLKSGDGQPLGQERRVGGGGEGAGGAGGGEGKDDGKAESSSVAKLTSTTAATTVAATATDCSICYLAIDHTCRRHPCVFLPCGHSSACLVCAERCWGMERKECPLCKAKLTMPPVRLF